MKFFQIVRVGKSWDVVCRGNNTQNFPDPVRKERFPGDLEASSLVEAFQLIAKDAELPWIQMSIPRPEGYENELN